MAPTMPLTLPLHQPPHIAAIGVGVHGVVSDHDRFRLPDLWQLHVYDYSADYAVDGVAMRLAPGTVSLAPPEASSTTGIAVVPRICTCTSARSAAGGSDQLRAIPLQDAGPAKPELEGLLRRAVSGQLHGESRQAAAHVWSVLWMVAGLSAEAARPRSIAVEAAAEYIEEHLADPLSVAALARHCGLSHNHLTRLFAAHFGGTVVGDIRDRRMKRAHHLLTASTLPIASIAATVGIPDLQAFNKACRRTLGRRPGPVREAST